MDYRLRAVLKTGLFVGALATGIYCLTSCKSDKESADKQLNNQLKNEYNKGLTEGKQITFEKVEDAYNNAADAHEDLKDQYELVTGLNKQFHKDSIPEQNIKSALDLKEKLEDASEDLDVLTDLKSDISSLL